MRRVGFCFLVFVFFWGEGVLLGEGRKNDRHDANELSWEKTWGGGMFLLNNQVVSMRYQHVVSTQNMVWLKTWLIMTWVTFGSQNLATWVKRC